MSTQQEKRSLWTRFIDYIAPVREDFHDGETPIQRTAPTGSMPEWALRPTYGHELLSGTTIERQSL